MKSEEEWWGGMNKALGGAKKQRGSRHCTIRKGPRHLRCELAEDDRLLGCNVFPKLRHQEPSTESGYAAHKNK